MVLFKADGGGQYRLALAELGLRGSGRSQGVVVTVEKFMESSQLRLGEMHKEQVGGDAVELPVVVHYFPTERDLAFVVGFFNEDMDIRGQQARGAVSRW